MLPSCDKERADFDPEAERRFLEGGSKFEKVCCRGRRTRQGQHHFGSRDRASQRQGFGTHGSKSQETESGPPLLVVSVSQTSFLATLSAFVSREREEPEVTHDGETASRDISEFSSALKSGAGGAEL